LSDARGAAESRRAPHHALVQRHSAAPRFVGLHHQVQRLSLEAVALAAARSDAAEPWRRRAALAVMAASGFAGLGYQSVWAQQGALWLGHESAGVLAVVTAFFGGMGVGALALGGRIERSARPVQWYVACEALIAIWSLVLAFAMAPISST